MSDRVFALAWLCVCGLIVMQMWVLVVPFAYEPVGPKAVPLLLAGLMVLCCMALLAKPDRDTQWPEKLVLYKGLCLVLVLLVYARLFETLGFPLATILMVSAVSVLFGARFWTSLVSALVIGVGGYWLFDRILEVTLPLGVLAMGN